MLVKVLRPIPAGPVTHLPGEVCDGGEWANLRDVLAAELARPLTPDEAAAYAASLEKLGEAAEGSLAPGGDEIELPIAPSAARTPRGKKR